MFKRVTSSFIFMFFLSTILLGQEASFDWAMHDVGSVRMVLTNRGALNAKGDPTFDYPRLINCEHPLNSGIEHLTNTGLLVGAVLDGTRSVSMSDGESGQIHEMFPTAEPWDTVWSVKKREVIDIPYWPGYTGVSDQDFICRYNDYGPVSLRVPDHRPLGIEVIMTSYAWASPPLDQTMIVTYYIIPKLNDLTNVYLGIYMNGNVGFVNEEGYALDDESYFRSEENIQFCSDAPGGSVYGISMIGEKYFPPSNAQYGGGNFKTTYRWWNGVKASPPALDNDKYIIMSSGEQQEDQSSTGDGTKSMVAFGPYQNLNVGDTLKLVMAVLLGDTEQDIIERGRYISQLRTRNYKVPSPPPNPEITITPRDKGVRISWFPDVNDPNNPENFTDPDRADGNSKPFEGYKIYKSTESNSGPWTLLNQYDLINDYGYNTDIEHEFIDAGLLNNIEYYYTVTAYTLPDSTIDFPELESSKSSSAKVAVPGTPPPSTVGRVAVVPNPYRGDIAYHQYSPPWEKVPTGRLWMEQDRRIQFINLPNSCEIKIYTLAGDLVYTIRHDDPNKGYEDWNLTSNVGQAIASGIYLYTVQDLINGEVQVDKFVIIK